MLDPLNAIISGIAGSLAPVRDPSTLHEHSGGMEEINDGMIMKFTLDSTGCGGTACTVALPAAG